MTTTPFTHERHLAELAVLRASILTKQVLSTVGHISKEDASPVTIADFAAQALLICALHDAFPEDTFLGEEDSAALRSDEKLRNSVFELVSSSPDVVDPLDGDKPLPRPASVEEMLELIDLGGKGMGGDRGRFWVMDPVDGTATFLKGQQYAVSLALIEDGKEVVGVLGCPNLSLQAGRVEETTVDKDGLGVMLTAIRGHGSSLRSMTPTGLEAPQPLSPLKPPTSLSDLHFVNCAYSKTSRQEIIAALAETFGAVLPNTELWSSHMRYVALILGGGDLQLRIPNGPDVKMYVWDHAGAHLIFVELGGKATDLDGKEMDFGAGRDLCRNRGLVVARGSAHSKVLDTLSTLMNDKE